MFCVENDFSSYLNRKQQMKEHGDDLFRYPNIRLNFSSNIWTHADLSDLEAHLCQHIDIIRHYPEPEPTSLEHLIAS